MITTFLPGTPNVEQVQIRARFLVPDLHFIADTIELRVPVEMREAIVRLRRIAEDEQELYPGRSVIGEVQLEVPVPPKAQGTLRDLSMGILPSGINPEAWAPGKYEELRQNGLGNFQLSLDSLPGSARDFFNRAYEWLSNPIRHALALLSWRENLAVPPYIERASWPEWSLDGSRWFRVPSNNRVVMTPPNFLASGVEQDVQALLRDKITEPVGNELWRDAWHLRFLSPRSALTVGVAALETGLKELIGDLVPNAAWLVSNLPSPPVHTLMSEYVPLLPVRETIDGQPLRIPPEVIQACRKWINRRNEVVHGKRADVSRDDLEEFLLLARDLLRVFDYSRGHGWALSDVRSETLQRFRGG